VVGEAGGTSEEDGYAAACWLLEHHPDTTAIFAAYLTMAAGAFAALKARGLCVPDDVSVIGYDNSPLATPSWCSVLRPLLLRADFISILTRS
jgi:DNA-binding LacI/PurR family transcriptional regulator